MNVQKLVSLSGLLEEVHDNKEFRVKEYDSAVPIDERGNYPYDGNAICVYFNGGGAEIMSYASLAKKALSRKGLVCKLEERLELIDCMGEKADEMKLDVLLRQSSCTQVQIVQLKKGHINICYCGFCKGNYFYDKNPSQKPV